MLIPIFIALAAIIVAYFFLFSKQKSRILILGLMNSGKTTLFYLLKNKKFQDTFTSMKINKANVVINDKTFELEDIPGHASIRKNQLDFKDVKHVVFMIDSFEVMSNIDSLADYLYEIVTEVKNRVPIMIVFNKIEISLYKKEQMMKQILSEIQKKEKGFQFGENVNVISLSLKKEGEVQNITSLIK